MPGKLTPEILQRLADETWSYLLRQAGKEGVIAILVPLDMYPDQAGDVAMQDRVKQLIVDALPPLLMREP